jgi:glyoxylase-like metal-dependent hydrolase (beta-lactamase superfamily II)
MKIGKFPCGFIAANCYVVSHQGYNSCFLVDPGAPNPKLEKYIADEKLIPEYIILTHGHGDHTGGIDRMKELFPDIKLIAGKKEAKLLYNRDLSMGQGGIVADIEVTDGEEMDLCGFHLKFIETPGHTPGGICIYIEKEGCLFSGDTLFQFSIGRTDFPGGDFAQIEDSIVNKLFKLPDDTHVFCGHEGDTTIGNEKRYNPFVS